MCRQSCLLPLFEELSSQTARGLGEEELVGVGGDDVLEGAPQ